ncbi:hypothetical protein E4P42_04655 [Mycobacterium sp. PS03-16]|uniref:hypothetical protein n=1 Tax=Mycobacterium sp. PS03-16 TaxID=2559611 RepID=UPI0010748319|nr:hypothetical protein [Mycobacterium sp. PS03-16]TFV60240.1 hypothetical protein E4P42_04655 [Mycobacterium sp. PS03-16]
MIEAQAADRMSPNADAAVEAAENNQHNEWRARLAEAHDAWLDIVESYQERVKTFDVGHALARISRSSETKRWAESSRVAIEDIDAPYHRVHRALYDTWVEFSGLVEHLLARTEGPVTVAEQRITEVDAEVSGSQPEPAKGDIFAIVAGPLANTVKEVDAAVAAALAKELARLPLSDVVESLQDTRAEVEAQQAYSKSARTHLCSDTESFEEAFAYQLRSFFAAVGSRLNGTFNLVTQRDNAAPGTSPHALLCALLRAAAEAWNGVEAIDDYICDGGGSQ